MAEELLITPEITMHEEPGEIRINQGSGEVAVEIDDEEPPSAYDIPAEISITKVNRNLGPPMPNKSFLKVRSDLARMPMPHFHAPIQHHSRPPPLIRAGAPIPGLPPMPRLKLGAPRPPAVHRMTHPNQNPLASMFNMIPPNSMLGPPRPFVTPHLAPPRMRQPPPQQPAPQPPPVPVINNGLMRSPSVLRPPVQNRPVQNRPPQKKPPQRVPQHLKLIPQEPLPQRPPKPPPAPQPQKQTPPQQQPSKQNSSNLPNNGKVKNVQVPPPLRGNELAKKVLQNGGAYSFLNITVTSAPRKPKEQVEEEIEEEIDDDEELELDDVEPLDGAENGQNKSAADQAKILPTVIVKPPVPIETSPRRRIGTLKFVRTADGKGYMRRQTDNLLQKAKATAVRVGKKKKRRFFRGANYRFDGSSIKNRKRNMGGKTSKAPSEAGSEPLKEEEEQNVLSYLGIQRKEEEEKSPNKAKKSFRSSSPDAPPNSDESLTIIRKRKPVEEINSEQKKAKIDDNMPKLVRPLLPLANEFEEFKMKKMEEDSKIQPLSRTRPKEVRNLSESGPKLQPLFCSCAKSVLVEEDQQGQEGQECQAIETVGVSRIGCKNQVKDLKSKWRVHDKLPALFLCDLHISRMKSHQCCGFCGEFCAHGVFYMCRPFQRADPHLFHKSCYEKRPGKVCPHCQSTDKPMTVLLKLSMDRVPMSLLQTVSKMSFVKNKKTQMSDLILQRNHHVINYKLPNGNTISNEGLPEGLTDESLEKVIAAVEDKDKLKHTTRNMYTPTKSGDNVKIIQLLSLGYSPKQKFTDSENGTPLHVAASEGHVLTSHILVQAGAELDAIDDEQNTPLMLACIKGKANIVKYLLAAGADLTLRGDDGMTCLHLATQNGHLECVHVIMTQNNLPRKFINLQDEGGWTPLVWACENKHEEVIYYLLDCGADPLITDAEGNIALHWAALSGSFRTCELLLNHGCDVNATNSIGETPLHIALRQDHYECVVLFLMRRARLDLVNKDGKRPVECIVSKNPKCGTIVKMTTTLQDLMKDTSNERLEKIICNDLTKGKETNPIQCVNDLDDVTEPKDYVYVKANVVTSQIPLDRNISTLQHCKCTDNCTTEDTCNCSDLSVKSWYDLQGRLKDGFDYKEPPMIFECNDLCGCNVSSCHNRVLQHGISVRLQVFKAFGMGWGVRPLADVPKGSFVCEYVGELISDSEAETREDSYLFDLDNKDGDTFCIDANNYGNIARFINHSCQPNLTPVKVFASHQDLRFPHIALFANRDIKKGEELGFDYGEKFWVIKHKFFTCHCSSEKCRYSKSNINSFLREYYKRNGEPLPPELQQPPLEAAAAVKKPEKTEDTIEDLEKKLKSSPSLVIPLTKVNVKAFNNEENNAKIAIKKELNTTSGQSPETSSTSSSTTAQTRPRRSVTRKNAEAAAENTK